jgi:hypothetical protein
VLVLRRVHIIPQFIGREPELRLKADDRAIILLRFLCRCHEVVLLDAIAALQHNGCVGTPRCSALSASVPRVLGFWFEEIPKNNDAGRILVYPTGRKGFDGRKKMFPPGEVEKLLSNPYDEVKLGISFRILAGQIVMQFSDRLNGFA